MNAHGERKSTGSGTAGGTAADVFDAARAWRDVGAVAEYDFSMGKRHTLPKPIEHGAAGGDIPARDDGQACRGSGETPIPSKEFDSANLRPFSGFTCPSDLYRPPFGRKRPHLPPFWVVKCGTVVVYTIT